MKLNETRPNVETSGDWEEEFFSIKDQGMIFDILRSKMYSNPILAICREISCNARDAHREVGKSDVPIHIHLPNHLEKFYKIKDFGPGISPDRMLNIFIKYTASTKRDDNIQTGGFGLGAKTPFAYSDTFSIITVHGGIKYHYTCIIDASKVGKLMKSGQAPTDEPCGTEIQIPVKDQDFRFFSDWTESATRHWDVRPIIKGGAIVYQDYNKIVEGNGWAIVNNNDYYSRAAKMVIDGIEYPLELDSLRKYADAKLIDSARGSFVMYFDVGELTLSASREQIYLDKPTQEKIRTRMNSIVAEIVQKTNDKIAAFPNLWEANVYYRKELSQSFNNLDFLGKLSWNNIELSNRYITLPVPVLTFTKGKYSYRKGNDPDKITRSTTESLSFDENSALFLNDLPLKEPTPRHVKKAFEDDPKLKTLQVVCPTATIQIKNLNALIHLDKMNPTLLSSITKASARNYTAPTSRLIVFKLLTSVPHFSQIAFSEIEEDTNKIKVLCLLERDGSGGRSTWLKNKRYLSCSALKSLSDKNPKVSFYGVPADTPEDRIEEEFSDFISIDDFLDDKILNNKTTNFVEIRFAVNHTYSLDERNLRNKQITSLIKSKSSLFLQRLDLHSKIKKLVEGDQGLLEIYESVNGKIDEKAIKVFVKDNPEWDIDSINKEYINKYPLLAALNNYGYEQYIPAVAHYINLVDEV